MFLKKKINVSGEKPGHRLWAEYVEGLRICLQTPQTRPCKQDNQDLIPQSPSTPRSPHTCTSTGPFRALCAIHCSLGCLKLVALLPDTRPASICRVRTPSPLQMGSAGKVTSHYR